jgi:hypothetical protein
MRLLWLRSVPGEHAVTSPSEQLAEAARRIQGGQLAQQQHARQVADDIAASRPPAAPTGASTGQQQPGAGSAVTSGG